MPKVLRMMEHNVFFIPCWFKHCQTLKNEHTWFCFLNKALIFKLTEETKKRKKLKHFHTVCICLQGKAKMGHLICSNSQRCDYGGSGCIGKPRTVGFTVKSMLVVLSLELCLWLNTEMSWNVTNLYQYAQNENWPWGGFKLPIKSVLNILLNVTGVHQKYSIITCLCALKQNVPKNSSMLSNFLC